MKVSNAILTDTGGTPSISWGGSTIDNTLTFTGVGTRKDVFVYDNTNSAYKFVTYVTPQWDGSQYVWSYTSSSMSEGAHSFVFFQPYERVDVNFTVVQGTFSSAIATNTGATSSISGGTQTTYDHTLGLSGQANIGSTVQIFDNQTALGFATVGTDRNWSFNTSALANGAHNFSAHITTAEGTVRDYACETRVNVIDLIANGDFENGNTGFTTGYTMQSQSNGGAGTASVVTSAPSGWGMGASAGFGGSGKFLLVDGSTNSTNTPTVWAEKITGLEANTHYDFSFQMMTGSRNHSNLAVKNNGAQVFVTSMNDRQGWTNNTVDLVSDSNGSIDLSLVTVGNFNTTGNDFGLDHLSLGKSASMLRNWVVNGDFEDGNSGFTTGYTMQSQANGVGTAAVVTAPPAGWNLGSTAAYGGSGKFLMVDGSNRSTNTPTVWAERITGLEANTDYDFSFWMMTNSNASTLAISSNGGVVGTTNLQDGRNWTEVKKVVTSNSSGELSLSLATTMHYEAAGNDFGLDHIALVRHTVL
jgi:hypothetical protein